jgi:hypothetical protein
VVVLLAKIVEKSISFIFSAIVARL